MAVKKVRFSTVYSVLCLVMAHTEQRRWTDTV